ncbi:MAG: head-tail connector protein [Bacteroides sp.]
MELYVEVEELKAHLNIDTTCDDDYIEQLSMAAQNSVEKRIQCQLSEYVDEQGHLAPSLKHAIKIMVATLYDNREAVSFGQPHPVPYTLDYLITPFIKFR